MLGTVAADALAAVFVFQPRREPGLGLQRHPFHRRTQAAHVHMWRRLTIFRAPEPELELHVVDGPEARRAFQPAHAIVLAPAAMLSTLAYSPCEPYGKRVKWRSLSH